MHKHNLINELREMGIEEHILHAIEEVPREIFVPEEYRDYAYENCPQPIGFGQTISQPYTVAFMIQLLDLKKGSKVLEIGAGSGYNAAVMSKLIGATGKIYAVELLQELVSMAKTNLKNSGIDNVEVVYGNGYDGFEEQGPYDRIIVTAAAPFIPKKLMDQLKKGGVMVIPVRVNFHEVMTRIVKKDKPQVTKHGEFRFVPMKK